IPIAATDRQAHADAATDTARSAARADADAGFALRPLVRREHIADLAVRILGDDRVALLLQLSQCCSTHALVGERRRFLRRLQPVEATAFREIRVRLVDTHRGAARAACEHRQSRYNRHRHEATLHSSSDGHARTLDRYERSAVPSRSLRVSTTRSAARSWRERNPEALTVRSCRTLPSQ